MLSIILLLFLSVFSLSIQVNGTVSGIEGPILLPTRPKQRIDRFARQDASLSRSRVESSVSSTSIDQIKSKWTNSVGLLEISGHCHFRHRRHRLSERKKEIGPPPPVPGALRREHSDFEIRPLFFGVCKRLGVLGLPPHPTPPPLPDCGRRGRDGEGVMGCLLFYTDPGRRESTRYRGRGQRDLCSLSKIKPFEYWRGCVLFLACHVVKEEINRF